MKMDKFICAVCGGNHATFEHRICEKIKLMEIGVNPENLFLIIPDEIISGNESAVEANIN